MMNRLVSASLMVVFAAGAANAHSTAFVNGQSNNKLYLIDGQYNVIKKTVTGFNSPRGVAVAPSIGKAYVVNNGNSTVSVVDVVSGQIDQSFGTQSGPVAAAANFAATRLYVANSTNQSITVFDISSPNAAPTTIATLSSLGSGMSDIVVSSDDSRLYVAMTNGTVRVYDTTPEPPTLNTTVTVGGTPKRLALTPDGTRLFVSTGVTSIPYFDTSTFTTGSIAFFGGNTASSVAISPDGTRLYVGVTPHNVNVYDGSTLANIANVSFGGGAEPIGIDVTDDGGQVFVAVSDTNSRTVKVIDASTNTLATTISLETTGTVVPLGLGNFVDQVGPVCVGTCRIEDLICRGSTAYGLTSTNTAPWTNTNLDGCTIADICPCLQPTGRVFWRSST